MPEWRALREVSPVSGTSVGVVREVSDATFQQEVLDAGEPVRRLVGARPEAAVHDLLGPARHAGSVPPTWVPVDACTLPTAEQPGRVAEFYDLFTAALRGIERRERGWLRLRLAGDSRVETTARELIERESRCCTFFDFQLTPTGGELHLDVLVPDSQVAVLDGIARQAEAAQPPAGAVS